MSLRGHFFQNFADGLSERTKNTQVKHWAYLNPHFITNLFFNFSWFQPVFALYLFLCLTCEGNISLKVTLSYTPTTHIENTHTHTYIQRGAHARKHKKNTQTSSSKRNEKIKISIFSALYLHYVRRYSFLSRLLCYSEKLGETDNKMGNKLFDLFRNIVIFDVSLA